MARDVLNAADLPDGLPLADRPIWDANGGSAIFAPGREYLAGPQLDKEAILFAEIDLDRTIEAKRWVDSVGHYSRPDVFQLCWDRRPKKPVRVESEPPAPSDQD